jgi:hypothetical protein
MHPIALDSTYQQNRIVHKGHYSSFDCQYPIDTTNIIFVKHNPEFDLILLTNIFYRCHSTALDVDDNNVTSMHTDNMFNPDGTVVALRNNWYAKLMERHFALTEKKYSTDLPTFDFDYASFFSLDQFLLELKKVADFLNNNFVFDKSLVSLWQEFIDRNQGYQLFLQSNQVFNQIVSGESFPIDPDWKMQAYINYKISTTFKLYDQLELFQKENYPTNTKQIYELIIDHIENYHQKFV